MALRSGFAGRIPTLAPGADDGLAVDNFSLTPRIADFAPEVADTFPDNGATDFPVNANLSVTFSEPVNVTPPGLPVCSTSGTVSTTFQRRAHHVHPRPGHIAYRTVKPVP